MISKENASIYLSSYLNEAAISKSGVNAKLIFETENPNRPGTITEKTGTSLLSKSAAIGSPGVLVGANYITGNMEFNSGNITAEAFYDGAGIGGGNGYGCNLIYINGGSIIARGGQYGAGIGGGLKAGSMNIFIRGGTVYAYAGAHSAGIGGGGNTANSVDAFLKNLETVFISDEARQQNAKS